MYYVQFFQKSANSDAPIEACGDRSVVILDGRGSRFDHNCIAVYECAKRGYIGWQLFKGDTFTRSSPISKPVFL